MLREGSSPLEQAGQWSALGSLVWSPYPLGSPMQGPSQGGSAWTLAGSVSGASVPAPGAACLLCEEAQFCCPLTTPLPPPPSHCTRGIAIPASTRKVGCERNMAQKMDGQRWRGDPQASEAQRGSWETGPWSESEASQRCLERRGLSP